MSSNHAVSDPAMIRLIQGIVRARAPANMEVALALQDRRLTDVEREELRELLADELVETGLGPDDEPNEQGRRIEAAIDWLAHR